jgi:NAD(P)H-hydrate repair Nnr-like enzyme with NAD(P)H-hydrate dehydratase domain
MKHERFIVPEISTFDYLFDHRNDSNILTPHPGEMKRLLEAFDLEYFNDKTREEKAEALAECLDATIVFKGSRTVIASPDGQITVNSSGCPALATAGSGDSLTGIIAALNGMKERVNYQDLLRNSNIPILFIYCGYFYLLCL